jgi:hypothetical protein
MGVLERGSEWRRWDLHVHTPDTAMADRFGDWDEYFEAIRAAPKIAVVGVTDYLTITNYKRVRAEWLAGTLPDIKLVIPNVEFRVTPETEKAKAINLHILIDPSVVDHEARIEEALGRLQFKYLKGFYHCSPDGLRKLGKDHNPEITDDTKALEHGTNQFKIEFERFREWYDQEDWLKANSLIAAAASKTDGLAGLPYNSGFAAVREEITRYCDIIFSGRPGEREFWLGRGSEQDQAALKRLGGRRPCLHGSDAHEIKRLFMPDEDRFCWIKADCTFEGLRQTLFEPDDRVYIGTLPPVLHDESRVITAITLEGNDSWFAPVTIPCNSGLVGVIGQKGSGKSALAELVAAASGSLGQPEKNSFLSRSDGHLDGTKVTLTWMDGHVSKLTIGEKQPEDAGVRFLSQRFVERLCAEDHVGAALVQEVEAVIFASLDPTDTLNASDFAELRALQTKSLRDDRDRTLVTLQKIIREADELRAKRAKLPELRGRIATLKEEDDNLRKQLPFSADPVEAKLHVDLEAARGLLNQLQTRSATDKQMLVKVQAVRGEVDAFGEGMKRFYAAIQSQLAEIGVTGASVVAFEPKFTGDVAGPLVDSETRLNAAVAARLGFGETPLAGTIRYVENEISRLTAALKADKSLRDRVEAIQKRLAAIHTEIQRIEAEIAVTEGKDFARLKEIPAERMSIYLGFFKTLRDEQIILQNLYGPVRKRLETGGVQEKSLDFYIRWDIDVKTWLDRGVELFDQRRGLPHGDMVAKTQELLEPAWRSGDAAKIEAAVAAFIEPFGKTETLYLRSGIGVTDVQEWLFSVDHIRLTYGLRYNGADLDKLSPGTKGIVLLILYLGMDTDDSRPLIIDQPEENLDSESIYDLLVHYFRAAKRRRQIILITHNPNLVVNTDADQVIVATCGRSEAGMPAISYEAGGLEDAKPVVGIRAQVCRILEGGERAFHDREQRYALTDELTG